MELCTAKQASRVEAYLQTFKQLFTLFKGLYSLSKQCIEHLEDLKFIILNSLFKNA